MTIAVLINTEGALEDALTIEGRIAGALFDLGEPVLNDVPLTAEKVRMFSGSYADGSDVVRIQEEDGGKLQYAVQSDEASQRRLLYPGDTTFGWTRYPLDRLVFSVENDRVVGLSEYYNGMFAVYRRPLHPSTMNADDHRE